MCLVMASQLALSQEQYKSSRLRGIAQLLKNKNRSVEIERDSATGTITHIGLPIHYGLKDTYPYNVLVRFVQRYGLYASLLSDAERRIATKADKVTIDVKRVCSIDTIESLSFDINKNNIDLTLNDIHVVFPNDWQLISGMNKIECEQDFYQSLIAFADRDIIANNEPTQVEPISQASYYKEDGNCYLIKEINQDKYYVKLTNDSIKPIYSSNYPSESMANLMQNLVTSNFYLKVDQNLYGYKKRSFTLPLSSFIKYCSAQDCETYVGIESESNTSLKAIVVYRNPIFLYNHLLCIDIDKKILAKQEGTINGLLYCYLPTHNLKNLFRDGK